MLPGFRFIVMTFLLGTSVLIFGLGAAALLRVTHEEVISMPSLRTVQYPIPPVFAERSAPTVAPPTLSLLRVDPPADTPAATPAPAAETATALLQTQPDRDSVKTISRRPAANGSSRRRLQARRARAAALQRRVTLQRLAHARMLQQQQAVQTFLPPLFGN
jgi:hypothetical protein